jgi:uncharacterized protein YgiM (DUF1202 family)
MADQGLGPGRIEFFLNMRSYRDLPSLIILTLLLGLAASCAKPQVVAPPEGPFYALPEMTYLLDSPGYGGNVLGSLYQGDKVERVEKKEIAGSNWWRVNVLRTGQTGWVQKELLSPDPVPTSFFYVNQDTLALLECPRSDCIPIQLLFRGEKLQRVEENDQGWWRVLAINNRSLGWVRAVALTDRLEVAQQKEPRKTYYYVAVPKLQLRATPSIRGQVIRTLEFNNQVQKMGETPGWLKVRQPASGAMGWIMQRDVESLPLLWPRGLPAKNKLRPFKQREEPLVEPEFM